jgi:putative membrane protein
LVTCFVIAWTLALGAASAQDDAMKKDEAKQDEAKKDEMKKDDAMPPGMKPDQGFVTEASTGGMLEVKLGQLAVDKAESPDVKQFGQKMVDDHSKANGELTQLAGTKGIPLPTELGARHQGMVDKLSALSGAEFDREYMAMMVDDHKKDVSAFERESKNGKDPEVKAWAAQTLPTLKEHQKMAKDVSSKVGKPSKGDMKPGM